MPRIIAFGKRIDENFTNTAINPRRYCNQVYIKRQIMLHYTAGGGTGVGVRDWWENEDYFPLPRTGCTAQTWNGHICTPFVVDPDGTIHILYTETGESVHGHLGWRALANQQSIGIEIINIGWLKDIDEILAVNRMTFRIQGRSVNVELNAEEQRIARNYHGFGQGGRSSLFNTYEEANLYRAVLPRYYIPARPINQQGLQRATALRAIEDEEHRYIHLTGTTFRGFTYFASFEEEQINGLILLVKYLCRKHHVPVKFFDDKRARYINFDDYALRLDEYTREETRSALPVADIQRWRRVNFYRFRGIIAHQNTWLYKQDVGSAFHWNKFYRGISDEWWLPCEVNNSFTRSYILNINKEKICGDVPAQRYEKMEETKSYFSHQLLNDAFAMHENGVGGFFPVGKNNNWHGGIHLYPLTNYPPNGVPQLLSTNEFNSINSQLREEADRNHLNECYENTGGRRRLSQTLLDTEIRQLRTIILRTNYNLMYYGKIFAAATGTIIASRIPTQFPEADEQQLDSENDEFVNLDNDPDFGSRRFVLIRHKIFTDMEAGQDIIDFGNQDNNEDNSITVYSLYMHLAPPAHDSQFHEDNPEWLNKYIERGQNVDTIGQGEVFFPDIEVFLGDYIGDFGFCCGQEALHFEVFSNEEFDFDCWANQANRIYDDNQNIICEDLNVDNALKDVVSEVVDDLEDDNINIESILPALVRLREVKCYYKTEWSAQNCDVFGETYTEENTPNQIEVYSNKIEAFSWWEEVSRHFQNDADTNNQLNEQGMVWHYHPFKLIEYINDIIETDQGHLSDSQEEYNTVHVDRDYYITGFESGNSPSGNTQRVSITNNNSQSIVYYSNIANNYYGVYNFSQYEIVCTACFRDASIAEYNETKLYSGLLEVLQAARTVFSNFIEVLESYVCPAHLDDNSCTEADEYSELHEQGKAIDFRPSDENRRTEYYWKMLYKLLILAISKYQTNNISYELRFPLKEEFDNDTDLTDDQIDSLDNMRMHMEVTGAVVSEDLILEDIEQEDHTGESPPYMMVKLMLNRSTDVPELEYREPNETYPHHRYFIILNPIELSETLRDTDRRSGGQYIIDVNLGELDRIRYSEDTGERKVCVVLDVNEGTQCSLEAREIDGNHYLVFDVRPASLCMMEIIEDDQRNADNNPYMGLKLKLNRSITLPDTQELQSPHRYYIDLDDIELSQSLRDVPLNTRSEHEITYNKGHLIKARFFENRDTREIRFVADVTDQGKVTFAILTENNDNYIHCKVSGDMMQLENIRDGNHLNESPPSMWLVFDLNKDFGLERFVVQDKQANTEQHHFLIELENFELTENSPVRQWSNTGNNQFSKDINTGELKTIYCTYDEGNKKITIRINAGRSASCEKSNTGSGSDYRIILKILNDTLATEENIDDLACIIMSEASIGNATEREAVAWTVRNRLDDYNLRRVSDVSGAYATNQTPPANSNYHTIAEEVLSAGSGEDITNGCTHFFSPRAMPKEGESTTGYDVGGGLHDVEGIDKKVYFPGWALTMTYEEIAGVRGTHYRFYR